MRRRQPGIGEITSVIIIIATFAVATTILVLTYSDQAESGAGAIRQKLDIQKLKAEELMDTSAVNCAAGTIDLFLHNYGLSAFDTVDMRFWKAESSGEPSDVTTSVDVRHLNGTAAVTVQEGDTVRITLNPFDCDADTGDSLIIVTATRNYMVISP